MTQRYRLADQVKVANDVSALLYKAGDALKTTPSDPLLLSPVLRAKLSDDLIGASAGALTHKPPAAVLETLVWVVELAQDRATGADFNTPQEALDEHDALAFVADWLKAQGMDVSPIIGAQPSAEAITELMNKRDAAQAELDALELGRFIVVHGVSGSPMGDRLPGRFDTYEEAEEAAEPYRKPGTWAYVDEVAS